MNLDEVVPLLPRFGERVTRAGLHFEGRPFPLTLRALVVEREHAAAVGSTVEQLHEVLTLLADLYPQEEWVRARFPSYPAIQDHLMAADRPGPANLICRFDGALDRNGDFRLFETNATSPGGVIQTGIAGRLWGQAAEEWGIPRPVRTVSQPIVEEPDLFARTLVDAHRAWAGRPPEVAAVVNHRGRFSNEVDMIRPALERLGLTTAHVDARELRRDERGRIRTASGLTVDLGYNKLSAPEMLRDPDTAEYLRAAVEGDVVVVNPLFSVSVLDDKSVLGVLTDERFLDALPARQRDLVRRHVPWSRLLTPERTTAPDGGRVELADYVLSARPHLVLKPTTLTRGEGVLIGPETPDEQWRDTVRGALGTRDHVVQEYVELPRIDVPMPSGVVSMGYGLDTYLFAGRCVGLNCRASLDGVVNLGKRGALLPVLIEADVERGDP